MTSSYMEKLSGSDCLLPFATSMKKRKKIRNPFSNAVFKTDSLFSGHGISIHDTMPHRCGKRTRQLLVTVFNKTLIPPILLCGMSLALSYSLFLLQILRILVAFSFAVPCSLFFSFQKQNTGFAKLHVRNTSQGCYRSIEGLKGLKASDTYVAQKNKKLPRM